MKVHCRQILTEGDSRVRELVGAANCGFVPNVYQ